MVNANNSSMKTDRIIVLSFNLNNTSQNTFFCFIGKEPLEPIQPEKMKSVLIQNY